MILQKIINSLNKTIDFIKINLFNKTYASITMINSLSETDDFIKDDKFFE